MTIEVKVLDEPKITCANCEACCCRLEVMLITDTGVPEHYIAIDPWGGQVMARRCSLYVLVTVFTPPNNHDFASSLCCSRTRNHAK